MVRVTLSLQPVQFLCMKTKYNSWCSWVARMHLYTHVIIKEIKLYLTLTVKDYAYTNPGRRERSHVKQKSSKYSLVKMTNIVMFNIIKLTGHKKCSLNKALIIGCTFFWGTLPYCITFGYLFEIKLTIEILWENDHKDNINVKFGICFPFLLSFLWCIYTTTIQTFLFDIFAYRNCGSFMCACWHACSNTLVGASVLTVDLATPSMLPLSFYIRFSVQLGWSDRKCG